MRWLATALVGSVVALALAPPVFADANSAQITSLEISEIPNSLDMNAKTTQHLVTLAGEYTNNSGATISKVDLSLVTSGPLRNRNELRHLLAKPNVTSGKPHNDIFASLHVVRAGEKRSWQISFIGEDVFDEATPGVYGIGILPKKSEYGSGVMTATPWFYHSDTQPTKTVLAIQLSTLNTHLANGKVTSPDSDASEIERLNNLLALSDNQSINWLLDPALISWASTLNATNPTAGSANLVAKLAALPPTLTQLLPYAHSDLAALLRANRDSEAELTINASRGLANGRNIFYAPLSGNADRKSINRLNELGLQSIISNTSLRGRDNITVPARVVASTNPVLVYDSAASNCLNLVSEEPNNFPQLTCLKNQLGMITAESPQATRNIIVLAPPMWRESSDSLTQILSALSGQNWVNLVSFDSLAPSTSAETLIPQTAANQRTLSLPLLKQAALLSLNTESVSTLFDDQGLASGFTSARLLAYSDLFDSDLAATIYLNSNYKILNLYLRAIRLEASRRITISTAESEIPVTVVNGSDKAVSVSVDIKSNAASRFSAQPTGIIQVAPGQRVTVPVRISLAGTGIVAVSAQLVAPNGEPFGSVQNIEISSAGYSTFARTLVWGAFTLLILLAFSNFIKRRKTRLTQVD